MTYPKLPAWAERTENGRVRCTRCGATADDLAVGHKRGCIYNNPLVADGGRRDTVYKTRLVPTQPGRQDDAVTVYADPDEAKRYLEGYVATRFPEAEFGEWRTERSADEKWSASVTGIGPRDHRYRAVVMGVDLRHDAESHLEGFREVWAEVQAAK